MARYEYGFISFDGADGSGKSTQVDMLSQYMTDNGIPHVISRTPGHEGEAGELRRFLLNRDTLLSASTMAYLYAAGFRYNLENIIIPALRERKFVIADRWTPTSAVYQGIIGRRLDLVRELTKALWAGLPGTDYSDFLRQSTMFLVDVDFGTAVSRIRSRGNENVWDTQDELTHHSIVTGFQSLYWDNKTRVDGNRSKDVLHHEVLSRLKETYAI